MLDIKINEWNKSYKNGDNFIFYPHEEIIRFVSKYFRKRIDIDIYSDMTKKLKGLDFGCGIGRHVFFMDDFKINSYGVDISNVAINKAHEWASFLGKNYLVDNIIKVTGNGVLPFSNNYFDLVVSHGVFDSMTFPLAKQNLKEIEKVIKNNGLVYVDLISGDDNIHPLGFSGEEIINTIHEKDTVQSFYNYSKIQELITDTSFIIEDLYLIRREKIVKYKDVNSRYHLILRKVI